MCSSDLQFAGLALVGQMRLGSLACMELHCPSCGERLNDAPIHLGDRCCPYCGSKASERRCLAALSREQEAAKPLSDLPAGVTLSEDDYRFRIELTTFDEVGAAVCWLATVAMLGGGAIFLGRNSLSAQDTWICLGIYAAVAMPLALAAGMATWGIKTVDGTADRLVFATGFRRLAWRRTILRSDLRSVTLERRDGADSDGRRTAAFLAVLRLTDGSEATFGSGQPYKRMAWVVRYLNEAA